MESKHYDSQSRLESALDAFEDGFLFRGQINHFPRSDGLPSLTSSFARHGCIPPLMRKWVFYANEMLRVLGSVGQRNPNDPDWTEALLQHYGWRSFYVDATEAYPVAAWFASHAFELKHEIHSSETCHEEGVLLWHDSATYRVAQEIGHIYVISKELARVAGHKVFDLNVAADFRCRPAVQKAWLVGPLASRQAAINPECLVAHITAPTEILARLAEHRGYSSTETLFPSANEDAFLRLLSSLPWEAEPDRQGKPVLFTRGLRIPDYDTRLVRWFDEGTAFYTPYWICETRPVPLVKATFFKVPEICYYASQDVPVCTLGALLRLLAERKQLVIETDKLISFPYRHNSPEYTKGVYALQAESGLIEVGEMCVEHPGRRVTGVGLNRGYSYRRVGDSLVKCSTPGDCPCGDVSRHEHHLRVLCSVNEAIARQHVKCVDELLYEVVL